MQQRLLDCIVLQVEGISTEPAWRIGKVAAARLRQACVAAALHIAVKASGAP